MQKDACSLQKFREKVNSYAQALVIAVEEKKKPSKAKEASKVNKASKGK